MGVFDWLADLFGSEGGRDEYWVHVRCGECGEPLRTRVDLAHDLSVRYDSGDGIAGYFSRKTLIGGGPCFNQVKAEIEFSPRRQALDHRISGGELITREEFEDLQETEPA